MYLQHVSIPRPPGPESRQQAQEFFGGLLGLKEKPVPKSIQQLDLVWFEVGKSELHVFAEEVFPSGKNEDKSGRHFCLVTADVEETRQKLTAAGYAPWNPEEIPGRPRFFCRDPFGNTIEFTTITADYLALEN